MPHRKSGWPYRFRRAWAFPRDVVAFLQRLLVSPSLHVACGESALGDVRVDLVTRADVRAICFICRFATKASQPCWLIRPGISLSH